jgi:hypothetical protein
VPSQDDSEESHWSSSVAVANPLVTAHVTIAQSNCVCRRQIRSQIVDIIILAIPSGLDMRVACTDTFGSASKTAYGNALYQKQWGDC